LVSVVVGVGLRIWVISSSSLGSLDSDEAVWGLMARHLLDGHWSTFYWGQTYGGTIETVLTAGVFAIFGTSTVALKLVPTVLYALAALLVWRVGRRIVGEQAGRVAAALFWIWPAYFVWRSTKAYGFYGSGLVLGLIVMLAALRLAEHESRRDLVVLGLAFGLGWWTSPQVLILAVPPIAWLIWRRPRVVRGWWLAVPAAAVGALPWLITNIRHDWSSLQSEQAATSKLAHVHNLVSPNLPTALGLRVPFSLEWLVGPVAGWLLYVLVVAGVTWTVVKRWRSLGVLLLCCSLFPVLYVLSPYTYQTAEPRYFALFLPIVVLLLAAALRGPRMVVAGLAAACALSVAGLIAMERQHLTLISADGVAVPGDFGPLLHVLEHQHIDAVFANYWVAYRLGFESRERIVASPSEQRRYQTRDGRVVPDRSHSRYAPWDVLVGRHPGAAHVFLKGSAVERQARTLLLEAGYRKIETDGFIVYLPSVRSAQGSSK
jgi:4-amino-4-deoxy-L-arabinose transferase-like glycosyltransferase